jgi:hypothetical protein
MSRVSQIIIGSILLLLALVMLLMAMLPGEGAFLVIRLTAAFVAAPLGFACLLSWGRPYTTRVALGILCFAMVVMAIAILLSDKPAPGPVAFAALVAAMSGAYAITGFYPEFLPLSNVFGTRADEERDEASGDAPWQKRRRRHRPRHFEEEDDYEDEERPKRRRRREDT